ncbi:MAG: hypothetical protein LBF72_03235, partial [Holosporales bacterium]|nr:hypothetical protein [Holosporales bacterium]
MNVMKVFLHIVVVIAVCSINVVATSSSPPGHRPVSLVDDLKQEQMSEGYRGLSNRPVVGFAPPGYEPADNATRVMFGVMEEQIALLQSVAGSNKYVKSIGAYWATASADFRKSLADKNVRREKEPMYANLCKAQNYRELVQKARSILTDGGIKIEDDVLLGLTVKERTRLEMILELDSLLCKPNTFSADDFNRLKNTIFTDLTRSRYSWIADRLQKQIDSAAEGIIGQDASISGAFASKRAEKEALLQRITEKTEELHRQISVVPKDIGEGELHNVLAELEALQNEMGQMLRDEEAAIEKLRRFMIGRATLQAACIGDLQDRLASTTESLTQEAESLTERLQMARKNHIQQSGDIQKFKLQLSEKDCVIADLQRRLEEVTAQFDGAMSDLAQLSEKDHVIADLQRRLEEVTAQLDGAMDDLAQLPEKDRVIAYLQRRLE